MVFVGDTVGNLFLYEGSATIRKITGGIITTIAGVVDDASLNAPDGLALGATLQVLGTDYAGITTDTAGTNNNLNYIENFYFNNDTLFIIQAPFTTLP